MSIAEDPPPELPSPFRWTPPVRYGTRMLRRFGWFYHVLGLGRIMRRVRMEDHSVEQIRSASARGPVVYVLAHRSTLDHLALNTVLTRRRLPLSVWANGAISFFWQPVAEAWSEAWQRLRSRLRDGPVPDPVRSGWLSNAVAHGYPVTVFVEDPGRGLLGREPADALAAVLDAQTRIEPSIQLVPVMVVWDRAPQKRYGAAGEFLIGDRTPVGFLSQLLHAWTHRGEAFIQVGVPLDLRTFIDRADPSRRIRTLRTLLRRYLRKESRIVRGPRLLPSRDMKRIVLDNPPMRALAREEAKAQGLPEERVLRQMQRDYDSIAANFRWSIIRVLHVLLRPLWTRVFSGVDVEPEDLDRIRSAMRDGTAILVPCHKSHFDYVLLSWVFFHHDLIVPHVVAGMNLAIWPVSILLRGAGGFFIKRSFAEDRVFPEVFSRYLRELVRQGYPVEFFIEGGRTRSGQLLPPRVGVLGMVMEAAEKRPRGREVTLLPIALAYEQVAEEKVYARELGGEEKRPETVGQLVKARSVLRRRFGRVYLRVGEPIPCGPIVDAQGDRPEWSARPREENKARLHHIGGQIMHRIGQVMVVLPTSLVALGLLAHHRQGIREDVLVARCHRFLTLLRRKKAPEAATLQHVDPAIQHALLRFERADLLRAHAHEGTTIWAMLPEKRISLDFYKNQVLHYLALPALAAAALRGLPQATVRPDDLRPGFHLLLQLLRRERVPDPDRTEAEALDEALETLVVHGALERTDDGGLRVSDPERIGEIYGLFRGVLEAYVLVAQLDAPLREHGEPKHLVKAIQADREALLARGAVTRPEALSAVTLRNAVDAFLEEGVLRRERGALSSDPERRQQILATLSPMVD